ncbi:hypothetical protein BJ742DRAFT_824370 [Cladochytrium replicatum]|nr:hypothetical protein BJ742DRAFT_824370 [Cladochytrium replicatum]
MASQTNNIVPSDAIILRGDCIVTESTRTGESVPVSKYPSPTRICRPSIFSKTEEFLGSLALLPLERHQDHSRPSGTASQLLPPQLRL